MAERIVITDEAAVKTINSMAKKYGVEPNEAAVKLIGIAKSRVNALMNYAAKPKKASKAKAPKAKRTPKAKVPKEVKAA